MKALHTTLAAVLLAASGFASAAPAFEGGQAGEGLTFEPVAAVSQRSAADVRAEGTAAVRTLDSRDGQQAEVNAANAPKAAGTRARADVRSEGAIAARSAHQAFEGGEAS
jgi:hypothetical protein